MIALLLKILSNPKAVTLGLALVCAAALAMALVAQYAFGLAPCNLCVIQRWPYGIVIALGLAGFALSYKNNRAAAFTLALTALALMFNSVVAFYHSGVERLWWKSFLEGCNVPALDPDNILASIEAAPTVRCDEIPWADPFFGLSMANYNVVFCLGLAVVALTSAFLTFRNNHR